MWRRRSSPRPMSRRRRIDGACGVDLSRCELCPRRCGVDRLAGARGWCQAGAETAVYRYAPHFGEEPPISGDRGSGTVFFSHCTLACLYCQNYPWSQQGEGDVYDRDGLADVFRALAHHGCHNWNLVSPTPWLPSLHEVLGLVRAEGVNLPVVYNTSGYERVETLRAYADDIQVYLTDLRYARADTARAGSAAADYVENARRALVEMWSRLGPLSCDENGVALSGVICRILVLPDLAAEAVGSLEWIAATLGTGVHISLMAQYQPAWKAVGNGAWGRSVGEGEYGRVCEALETLGFENGWMQEYGGEKDAGIVGHDMPRGGFDRCGRD